MKTVRNVLSAKGEQVFTAAPDTPVLDAMRLMNQQDIGALIIMEGGTVAGIFTERDYARRLILQGRASTDTCVREVMSTPVISVRPQQTVLECMSLMNKLHIRYLPVIERNQLKGILSIGDVLHAVIVDQEEDLKRMEQAARGETGLLE